MGFVVIFVVVGFILFGLIAFKAYARERKEDYRDNLDSYEVGVRDAEFNFYYHGRNG